MSSDPAQPKLHPTSWYPGEHDPPHPVPLVRPAVSNLPALTTSLIGRETDIAAACAMLTGGSVRLLTLTGPGGVGKTRLAIRIGEVVKAAFADGVVFVPLAPILDRELVLPTIARALGIRDSGERARFETVADLLRPRHLLLILDNMEHLREVSPLLANLLMTCQRLTILVTSRGLLRVSGERAFPVAPLAVNEAEVGSQETEGRDGAPAVRLFVERARAAEPSFTLTANNLATIGTVCRQLDGLPLAIELAAARLRILSPQALLTDLEHRLRLLTDGPHDAPARLRTMHNAIAWSVDRLSEAERSLFCRLGVFVDGFTLDAVEAIGSWPLALGLEHDATGTSELQSRQTIRSSQQPTANSQQPVALDLVMSLVGQSLVQRIDRPGELSRYRMLETIRAYALSELTASGDEAAARGAHAAWCLALAERAEHELSGPQQKAWFDRLEAEQPNMRSTLHWLLAKRDAERGLHLASMLTWFWSSRSYFHEAQEWLETFLALPTSEAVRGRGLLDASNILHWRGQDDEAARYSHEALAIFRKHNDAFLAMCTLRRLGSIAINQEEFAQAEQFLAESQALLHAVPPPWDPRWDAAFATYLSGRLAAAANRSAEAVAHFAEASAAFGEIGDRGYVAAALGLQGAEWIKQGEITRARDAYATSLELAIELADHTWEAWALLGAAHLAHDAGDNPTAARLLGAATSRREAIGERRLPKGTLTPALQTAVAEEPLRSEWLHGTTMPAADAVAMAREIFQRDDDRQRLSHKGRQPQSVLTAREREVLCLLADGLGDKEIGLRLSISRRTASQHVAAILDKLGVASRTAAVAIAVRQGLFSSSASQDRPPV